MCSVLCHEGIMYLRILKCDAYAWQGPNAKGGSHFECVIGSCVYNVRRWSRCIIYCTPDITGCHGNLMYIITLQCYAYGLSALVLVVVVVL